MNNLRSIIIAQARTFRFVAGWLLLISSATAQPVTKVVLGTSRALNPDWIGGNANLTALSQPGNDDEFVAAVQELGIQTIRYPGGTIGNYWDWDRGWLDPTVPDSLMIPWVVTQGLTRSQQRYTLEDLALLTRRTQTIPVFMLNMLSKDLAHSLRNLRKAKALGMPIKYVELGNELYFDLPFPKLKYPTPEIYGDTCQRWITAIKREFPEAQCAVVGSYLTRHDRQRGWTKRVLAHCSNADAVTFHRYSPSGLDGQQEKKRITAGTEGSGDQSAATRTGPTSLAQRQAWEREQLRDEAALANTLTTARHGAQTYRKMQLPDTLPIWVTEFNMRDDHSVVLHSWSHALILAEYYLEFLNSPVAQTNVHNLVGHLFGQVHTDTTNFSHILASNVASKPYTLTAGGIATSLLAQATKNATEATYLEIEGVPLMTDDRGASVASVQGYLFTDNDGRKTGLIVNFGYDRQSVLWPSSVPMDRATSYGADLARLINGWESLAQQEQKIQSETLYLPSHSITIVRENE